MENELLTAKEAVKKLKNDISETKKSVKESDDCVANPEAQLRGKNLGV